MDKKTEETLSESDKKQEKLVRNNKIPIPNTKNIKSRIKVRRNKKSDGCIGGVTQVAGVRG